MFTVGIENTPGVWIALLTGAVLALLLGLLRCRKAGVSGGRTAAALLLAPLFTAFFSHLLYCLAQADYVLRVYSPVWLFAFWQPGYMFYGGLLGATLALLIAGGSQKGLLEAFAPSVALMIAAARIAEGFLGQGYGELWYDDPQWFCRFPFMNYDPENGYWAYAIFMAEAAVAILLLIVLLLKKKTFPGDGWLLLCGLYASAQVVLESLRRDEFLRWGFVRVEEVFSGVVILTVLLIYAIKAGRGRALAKTLCILVFLSMAVLCLLLEFATEGRIPFLLFLEVYQCYLAMAGACCVMAGCVVWMRRICNTSTKTERAE
ncbi:MAG: prolipoprotein diacylglyceryl transferase [Clostridia bacterium]|nr:prolipoprotein diacylglyceryl transferase [Clostridia bacterium]